MSASMVPPWANPFLPRQPVMDDMAAHIRRSRERALPTLMYLDGVEGIGLSCLVTQFWKDYQDLIQGPLIWLSGRRSDGSDVPGEELFTRALRQLEVSEGDQGATQEEKADSFRAVAQTAKFLLVLDDLATTAQILAFIPPDAPNAIIVATSSRRRRTLERHDFEHFAPELLTTDASVELFRSGLGDTARSLDAETIDELTGFCGGIPLQVKVLAAQIHGRPPMAQVLLTQLRDSGIQLPALDDEQRMTRFLDTTYRNLTAPEQRAYRLLGSLPAADFSLGSAAAALGSANTAVVYQLLERLTELNLLCCVDVDNPRYLFHRVLHDDAAARAQATDTPEILRQTLAAWIDWNLRETLPRATVISRRWWVAPVTDLLTACYPHGVPVFDRQPALAWFDREEANLVATVRAAHNAELHDLAWPLCVALWKYLHLHSRYSAWIETHLLGVESARQAHCDLGVMQLSAQLGAAYLDIKEYAEARESFTRALALARATHHSLGEQSAREWLGKIAAAEGDFAGALAAYDESWAVVATLDDTRISAFDRARVFAILALQRARSHYGAGDFATAITHADHAITFFDQDPTEVDNSAKPRLVRARAHLALGATDTAITDFGAALALFTHEGAEKHQARTHRLLGDAHRTAGHTTEAITHYRHAFDYYHRVGSPNATPVAQSIAELEGGQLPELG
ncbi:tetratricopeptide repeat protein [Nocardia lasii]|uniref:Tetratricopeptide repeat protein n=1 Tax=Nocardia lasii TaxID=1616107 RepID=A0ABW1JMW6_9NOCA